MVDMTPVDPSEVPRTRAGRRGRVAYPIIKSFMESDHMMVKLDTAGAQQSMVSLRSCLTSYVRNHDLPVRVFSADGEMYLMRLDMDEDGNKIEDWKEVEHGTEGAKQGKGSQPEATPISPEEVQKRHSEEKGKTTK